MKLKLLFGKYIWVICLFSSSCLAVVCYWYGSISRKMSAVEAIASPIVVDYSRPRNEIFGTDSVRSRVSGSLFKWKDAVLQYSWVQEASDEKIPLIFITMAVSAAVIFNSKFTNETFQT